MEHTVDDSGSSYESDDDRGFEYSYEFFEDDSGNSDDSSSDDENGGEQSSEGKNEFPTISSLLEEQDQDEAEPGQDDSGHGNIFSWCGGLGGEVCPDGTCKENYVPVNHGGVSTICRHPPSFRRLSFF